MRDGLSKTVGVSRGAGLKGGVVGLFTPICDFAHANPRPILIHTSLIYIADDCLHIISQSDTVFALMPICRNCLVQLTMRNFGIFTSFFHFGLFSVWMRRILIC